MPHLTVSAHALLARQHGVITPAQLVAAGLRPSAIDRLVVVGALAPAVRGTYRSPSAPQGELSRCAALCLAHPDLVISGPTAGRHWGFRRLPVDWRIHAIAPPASHPCIEAWVQVYRTAAIHPRDVIELGDGRRVTSRPRTVLDLSRSESDLTIRSLIEQARNDGRHSIDEMIDVAFDWQSRRRPWLRRYLAQVAAGLPGGAAESHPELVVGERLVAGGVVGLRRQYRLTLPGRPNARFDLAVPSLRWAIEVDLFPTHREVDGAQRDRDRDAAAALLGWTTTRLGPEHFGTALDQTIADLVGRYHAWHVR